MKTPQKGGNSSKGKSKLSLNKKKQSQSIASLFKQQVEGSSSKEKQITNSSVKHNKLKKQNKYDSDGEDDDVLIVGVELKADKYFSPEKEKKVAEDVIDIHQDEDSLSKTNRLKLRRGRSSMNRSGQKKSEERSSKSISDDTLPQLETERDTNDTTEIPSQSSQKENSSRHKASESKSRESLSRRLSLRKRRSMPDETSDGTKSVKLKKYDTPAKPVSASAFGNSSESGKCETVKPTVKSSLTCKDDSEKVMKDTVTDSAGETIPAASAKNSVTICPKSDKVLNPNSENAADETVDALGFGDVLPSVSKETDSMADDDENATPGVEQSDNVKDSDNDSDNEEDVKDVNDKSKYRDRTPYYLENFTIVLNSVLDDPDYLRLFSDMDMKVVNCFKELSEPAQKLYVRLFSRKLTWHLYHKISYPEIADELTPVLQELITSHLAISAADLNDLDTVLKILPAAALKTLAKSFSINLTGLTKPELIEALLKQSKQNTIGSFFMKKSKGGAAVMLDRAKKLLGESFRLLDEPRSVFLRIIMLFSLMNYHPDEESNSHGTGGQTQLAQMLLVNMGKLVYPKYTLSKKTSIFQSKEDLLRFSSAMILENDLLGLIEKKDFKGACDLYLSAKTDFQELVQDKELIKWDQGLPSFLRHYTAREVYTRILSQGVEILQRLKQYKAAVDQLRELLDQTDYCLKYRGYWYERLALNLDQHLGQQQQSLEVIKEALGDQGVRVGHRYALYWRAKKLCTAPKSKFKEQLADIEPMETQDYVKVTIEGKVIPKTVPGARFTFVQETSDSEEGMTVCGVEELVLDYYRHRGFPEGLHAEGGIVSTLFGLCFWDIIFMDVPDAFHSPFQAHPLDRHSDHFYLARKSAIDRRLEEIGGMSEEDLSAVIARIWEEQNGVLCSGLNWDRFTSLEHAQGLVRCMGGKHLSTLLQRFAKDPRNTRSGFPDLTLWNPTDKTFKFCEVKGPGDRLSTNQIMWLDYLTGVGIDAEVCHVKAVTGKKLTRE